jgi:hypothetical protein
MKTKNEERQILNQIAALIAEAGENSYIGYAFEGCVSIARDNIDNDFANSLFTKNARLENDIRDMNKLLDVAETKIKNLENKLKERKPIPVKLYRDLWLNIEAQEAEAKNDIIQAAEILSYIESDTEVGIASYVNGIREARIRRDAAAQLLSELEKIEPKNA